jgi:dynein light chain roadblock-type
MTPATSTYGTQSTTTPPEIEQTLTMLSGHRSVLGYMVLSRSQPVCIVKHSGVIFEGEQGRKYAGVIGRIVENIQGGLEEISGEQNDGVGIHISWDYLFDGADTYYDSRMK